MSFRPHFSNSNNTFTSFSATNNVENINFVSQSNAFQGSIRNNFPNPQCMSSSNINRYPFSMPSSCGRTNQLHDYAPFPRPPIIAPPPSHPSSINTRPHNSQNFSNQSPNVNLSFHQLQDQSCNRNSVPPTMANSTNANLNFDPRNVPIQQLPPPIPNIPCNTLPPNYPRFPNNACFNNSGNIPISLSKLPQFPVLVNQNTTNILNSNTNYSIGNISNSVSQAVTYTCPLNVRSVVTNSLQDYSAKIQNNSTLQVPLQLLQNDVSESKINPLLLEKEKKISDFLAKISFKRNENKQQVTIPEFRYVMKAAISTIKLLDERKNKLVKLLDANENEWESEVENALKEQEALSTLCSLISDSNQLNKIMEKLQIIKKRRERKKKTKQNKLSEKMIAEQKRKERHQEIDKWLDNIKEKNQKIKREAELKKEADYILLEVRRKIYEAKKTIEKLRVFEKLRSSRQDNASKKGLHVLTMHNVKFEKKMSMLKETMMKQLADYEAEERALKVMLETEQEGQREEEAQWKIKKLKTLQEKRKNNILECLLGISDDPLPTDPLYLFHKYHTSATNSIENLVQIRHQWDTHMAEDGEAIPQQWVVPVAPSNTSWEEYLITPKN